MDRLSALQQDLKLRLVDGLDIALKLLGEELAPTSPKFDIFIQFKSRYTSYLKADMLGGLSPKELEGIYNQLTASFMQFVNSLTENDLKTIEPAAAKPSKKRGELLYHIPDTMQQNRQTACRVRVAYLLEKLMTDWESHDEDVQKNIRISEIMAVEMKNVGGEENFEISSESETVQFLEDEDFTEWLFYVRPLREGEYPLLIKVSIIEVIGGEKVKKDVVIEEKVIVATKAAEVAPVFQKAGLEMSFQTIGNQEVEASRGIPETAGIGSPQPVSSSSSAGNPKKSGMRVMVLFFAFLMAGAATMTAMTADFIRDFWLARATNTEAGYTKYIEKYKNRAEFKGTEEEEKAFYYRAMVSEQPVFSHEYLNTFPEGIGKAEYRKAVLERLKLLETKAVDVLKKNPTAGVLKKQVEDFPDLNELPTILEIVNEHPEMATELLPILETGIGDLIGRKKITVEQLKVILKNFPDSKLIDDAIKNHPENIPDDVDLESFKEKNDGKDENGTPQTDGKTTVPTQNPVNPIPNDPKNTVVSENPNTSTPPKTPINQPPGKNGGLKKTGFNMATIPAGTFSMGDGSDNDNCRHPVTIATFRIGKFEVTQADWREVMGADPSDLQFRRCPECPVEGVSWLDVEKFIKKANEKYPGMNYRLPTEAEWEYVARGGSGSSKYSGSENLDEVGWFYNNSSDKTHIVGTKKPNEFGIFDMSGNVWEWCADVFSKYPCDSKNRGDGIARVTRGGGWHDTKNENRVARRINNPPHARINTIGFRLARD